MLNVQELLSERRTALAKTFDARACLGSSLDDLHPDIFLVTYLTNAVSAETIAENRRGLREQLASLRFYDLEKDCPTFAGILLFGRDPLRWLPGACIQFLRFENAKFAGDVANERRFGGDLLRMLRELDLLISFQIQSRPEAVSPLREKMIQEYPLVALREFLINAIMHRNYEGSNTPVRFYWFSNRIEIQSPGGLYGEATPENFPRQNAYRNPIIAEAMKTIGYVNKYGRGVLRAQEALAVNGNPPAEFVFDPNYVLVTVRRKP